MAYTTEEYVCSNVRNCEQQTQRDNYCLRSVPHMKVPACRTHICRGKNVRCVPIKTMRDIAFVEWLLGRQDE